jgi:hypothetical protein
VQPASKTRTRNPAKAMCHAFFNSITFLRVNLEPVHRLDAARGVFVPKKSRIQRESGL